jgi:hypothetical protein
VANPRPPLRKSYASPPELFREKHHEGPLKVQRDALRHPERSSCSRIGRHRMARQCQKSFSAVPGTLADQHGAEPARRKDRRHANRANAANLSFFVDAGDPPNRQEYGPDKDRPWNPRQQDCIHAKLLRYGGQGNVCRRQQTQRKEETVAMKHYSLRLLSARAPLPSALIEYHLQTAAAQRCFGPHNGRV